MSLWYVVHLNTYLNLVSYLKDTKIQFNCKSNLTSAIGVFSELQHLASYVFHHNAMASMSFPPKEKAQILEDDALAHQKYWESLPPKEKAQILEDNAAAHQKYLESLPLKEKARILEDNAAAHQKHY
jgi:hypothetical protein